MMQLAYEYTRDVEPRFRSLNIIISLFFLVILGRLYFLQVIKGDFYRFFSKENSIKEMRIVAPRGLLLDRRGRALVDNRSAFDLVLIPQYVLDPPKVFQTLTRLLAFSPEALEFVWKKRLGKPKYQPVLVKSDISADEVAVIRSHKGPWYDAQDPIDLRGVEVILRYQRVYPEGDSATHLLGYTREIDAVHLQRYRELYPGEYRLGDQVGVSGLEETWERELRGMNGFEQHVVDAAGREVQYAGIADRLERRPAIPGKNLTLTIDHDLQEVARNRFQHASGAAVMLDVHTGGVLAFFSAPSYDLNLLSGAESAHYWGMLAEDERRPLIDRAIQGTYPPASTYKVVTAIASLAEGVVQPQEAIACHGAYMYGGRPYRCWLKGGHGTITLHQAIAQSCDVYFYLMGLRLGVDRLAKYAELLGFGKPTGLFLVGEKPGIVPTAEWKERKFGVAWQEGENLSIAVGQGYDAVTPLQNAVMAARVANGGYRVVPHVVDVSAEGSSASEPESLGIPSEILETVRRGMIAAVAEPGGTAHRLATLPVTIGGKTGTAQVVSLGSGNTCHEEWCRDHAWFIGFSPAEHPEVAVAVIVEHGGFGASAAAPIAGALFQKYQELKQLH